jgi:hypothetical protein
LDATNGTPIWSLETNSGVHSIPDILDGLYSSPAVSNGMLYVTSFDHTIYAIGSPSPTASSTPLPTASPTSSETSPTPSPTTSSSSNTTYYIIAAAVVIIIVVAVVALVFSRKRK